MYHKAVIVVVYVCTALCQLRAAVRYLEGFKFPQAKPVTHSSLLKTFAPWYKTPIRKCLLTNPAAATTRRTDLMFCTGAESLRSTPIAVGGVHSNISHITASAPKRVLMQHCQLYARDPARFLQDVSNCSLAAPPPSPKLTTALLDTGAFFANSICGLRL